MWRDLAHQLPALNAILNSVSAALAITAWIQIRRGNRIRHTRIMISAVLVSGLFLASYVTHKALFGTTYFQGPQAVRAIYLSILATHTILAAAIVPLIIATMWRAARGQYGAHRRLARWTLPAWIYVSVTGVIIYVMLYIAYPARA